MGGQTSFLSEISDHSDQAAQRISVLLPRPFAEPLDYLCPDECIVSTGDYVAVPIGKRQVVGVVWALEATDPALDISKIKQVIKRLDAPSMPTALRRLVDFTAAYTLSPKGAVLKMCLGLYGGKDGVDLFEHRTLVQHVTVPLQQMPEGQKIPDGLTPKRQQVYQILMGQPPMTVTETAERAGVTPSVVRTMASKGILSKLDLPQDQPFDAPQFHQRHAPTLSEEQTTATTAIANAQAPRKYECFLLDGVTGSGKTEVYFEAITKAMETDKGAQVLVLLPEIALTSQWLERFKARFKSAPAQWHSDVGAAEKRRVWRGVGDGSVSVVVGARSSLFLPFKDLSLIIVDEEHDPSFKQEEGVMYQARDMAVTRAFMQACPIILASATPSLESLANVEQGRYSHLILRERHGGAKLPDISAIDMRTDGPASGHWLSPKLVEKITETLMQGQQTALFLNRRGYAPLTLCRTCGHRVECPHCSAWLVEHRSRQRLQCHHCGFDMPSLHACPECDSEESLVACGPGVERLGEEVVALFPQAQVQVMTSDTMTSPVKMAAAVAQIEQGVTDIVIGTQMITKGYHFPKLTLVGVVDADLGLRGGDMRAGERTYQQLVQVAGRAGRESKKGQVFLQTFEPEHPVVQALLTGDGQTYMQAEIAARQSYEMPPFGKLVALILSGEDHQKVVAAGRHLARLAPQEEGVRTMGPAPAPMTRIRGHFRYRMLMQAPKSVKVQPLVRQWLLKAGAMKGVQIKIDVDPYSFF